MTFCDFDADILHITVQNLEIANCISLVLIETNRVSVQATQFTFICSTF